MKHTRKASREGWSVIVKIVLVVPLMAIVPYYFETGAVFSTIWYGILAFTSGIALSYAYGNIRKGGEFSCILTDKEFFQVTPDPACGDSFHIKLSEITQIEVRDGEGDGPSDEWFIHTKSNRHRINMNYGNPYRRFGESLQKALPHVRTIQT